MIFTEKSVNCHELKILVLLGVDDVFLCDKKQPFYCFTLYSCKEWNISLKLKNTFSVNWTILGAWSTRWPVSPFSKLTSPEKVRYGDFLLKTTNVSVNIKKVKLLRPSMFFLTFTLLTIGSIHDDAREDGGCTFCQNVWLKKWQKKHLMSWNFNTTKEITSCFMFVLQRTSIRFYKLFSTAYILHTFRLTSRENKYWQFMANEKSIYHHPLRS